MAGYALMSYIKGILDGHDHQVCECVLKIKNLLEEELDDD